MLQSIFNVNLLYYTFSKLYTEQHVLKCSISLLKGVGCSCLALFYLVSDVKQSKKETKIKQTQLERK